MTVSSDYSDYSAAMIEVNDSPGYDGMGDNFPLALPLGSFGY